MVEVPSNNNNNNNKDNDSGKIQDESSRMDKKEYNICRGKWPCSRPVGGDLKNWLFSQA